MKSIIKLDPEIWACHVRPSACFLQPSNRSDGGWFPRSRGFHFIPKNSLCQVIGTIGTHVLVLKSFIPPSPFLFFYSAGSQAKMQNANWSFGVRRHLFLFAAFIHTIHAYTIREGEVPASGLLKNAKFCPLE